MAKETITSLLTFFENELKSNGLKIYKMILFGSAIMNELHEESDIDIAIISDEFRDKNIFERAELTYKAEWMVINRFKVPLDVVKLTIDEYENETRMISTFVKEGRTVYSAE